jgi:hypothetical protein
MSVDLSTIISCRSRVFVPVLVSLTMLTGERSPVPIADDLWERSRTAYAGLHSYADVGVVTTEDQPPGAPLITERHTFSTDYLAPRKFYFEFRKNPAHTKERLVIWCDGGDFESWWSATGVHQTYPQGTGATAFAVSNYPTTGTVVMVPPLLFSKAGLQGPLAELKAPKLAGTEEVDGQRAYKLVGEVTLGYATGLGRHARPTTVWLDSLTLLVRKVVQDTPAGTPEGSVSRIITTYRPEANPALADSVFRFAVPIVAK